MNRLLPVLAALLPLAEGKRIAYVYGDVAEDGAVPSGPAPAYDQMLLDDAGDAGLSDFAALVASLGHTVTGHHDEATTMNATFLSGYDAVVFGLHQKAWATAERQALYRWTAAGGGWFVCTGAAAGGEPGLVGRQNAVGQTAANSLLGPLGMQALVDQSDGVKAVRASKHATHPVVADLPVLGGEDVSPVAVDPADKNITVLIPYEGDAENIVFGEQSVWATQNVGISDPLYAALAAKAVGSGVVVAMFDEHPLRNDGMAVADNRRVLSRVVRHLLGELNSFAVAAAASAVVTRAGSAALHATVTVAGASVDPLTYLWSLAEAPGSAQIAQASDPTASASAFSSVGGHLFKVTVHSAASDEAHAAVAMVLATDAGSVTAAVNCGSQDSFSAATGVSYTPDVHYAAGSAAAHPGAAVGGTADAPLYNTARVGFASYQIPVENGLYWVVLQLAETEFEGAGRRVFSVQVEGAATIEALDLFEAAGGRFVAKDVVAPVVVSDGVLNIAGLAEEGATILNAFVVLSAEDAIYLQILGDTVVQSGGAAYLTVAGSAALSAGDAVSWRTVSGPGIISFAHADDRAAAVRATFTNPGRYTVQAMAISTGVTSIGDFVIDVLHASDVVHAVHCGSTSNYTAATGITYFPDAHYTGGQVDAFAGNAVQRTADSLLYNYARTGMSAYSFPVANGEYIVFLQLAETYFTGPNKRVFDVRAEGALVFDDLDLVAKLGGKWVADCRGFNVVVLDGELTLAFSAAVDNALINAIVVVAAFDKGTIFELPAEIPAVEYRPGGQGVGYVDLTVGNSGGVYRPGDDVDIDESAGGGYNVGGINAGERLSYFARVTYNVAYKWVLRVASAQAEDKTVRLLIDGQVVKVVVFNTNGAGLQTFQDFVVYDVALPLGTHEFALAFDSAGFNVESFSLLFETNAVRSNAGGPPVSGGENPFLAGDYLVFDADSGFTGGSTFSTDNAIDVSGATLPAPQEVYQTERYGDVVYRAEGLVPWRIYGVKLHFAELSFTERGKRVFHINLNGDRALDYFDIFREAGGRNRAFVWHFNARADAHGRFAVELVREVEDPSICGVEMLTHPGMALAYMYGNSFTLTSGQPPAILDVLAANDRSALPLYVVSVKSSGPDLFEVEGNAVKLTTVPGSTSNEFRYTVTNGIQTEEDAFATFFVVSLPAKRTNLTSFGLTQKFPVDADFYLLRDGSLALSGGGHGFFGVGSDEVGSAWKDVAGDFDARLQVKMLTGNGPSPRTGLQVVDYAPGMPRFFAVSVTPTGGFEVSYRLEFYHSVITLAVPEVAVFFPAVYLRLLRTGSTVSGYYSTDNMLWYTIVSVTFPSSTTTGDLPTELEVGPFVFSGESVGGVLTDDAVVDNFVVLQ